MEEEEKKIMTERLMNDELGKDDEGSSRGLFWGIIQPLALRD
jgi:hypothetical protein